MDDDLQHPVSEIPVVLSKLQEGYDVVYGTPHQETHGLLRNLASQLTKLALRDVMGVENARSVSAFRAFKTSLRDGFADYRNPSVSIDVLLTWATSKFAAVPVRHEARSTGQSNYTLSKLVTHAFNLLTGFSTLPLRFASFIGVAFSIFGVLILTWVLGRFFISGSPVPGFPFLASMIAIFSGAQLLALGIFGEYLGRIHVRSLDRPAYLVREEADAADDATSKTLP
jgi:undecaprenyl-phosphate 4-deoxy-4-formamido-L-arabinose transferase